MAAVTASRMNGLGAFSAASTGRKRPSTTTSATESAFTAPQKNTRTSQKLPLKKRFYTSEDVEEAEEEQSDGSSRDSTIKPPADSASSPPQDSVQPVDFSLPNRCRAKASPKHSFSHTDTDSTPGDSPSSSGFQETAKPLDLTSKKDESPGSAFTPTWSPRALDALRLSSVQGFPGIHSGFFPFSLPYPVTPFASTLGASGNLLTTPTNLLNSVVSQTRPGVAEALTRSSLPFLPSKSPELTGNGSQSPELSSPTSYIINPATGNKVRRNYKNMTRERRMEANARERTRVHTIGASFDQLQKLVPSLAPEQKLSKLSILRIACKYIMLLASMNGRDYSLDQSGYSVEDCVEMLNDTIVGESKLKRQ